MVQPVTNRGAAEQDQDHPLGEACFDRRTLLKRGLAGGAAAATFTLSDPTPVEARSENEPQQFSPQQTPLETARDQDSGLQSVLDRATLTKHLNVGANDFLTRSRTAQDLVIDGALAALTASFGTRASAIFVNLLTKTPTLRQLERAANDRKDPEVRNQMQFTKMGNDVVKVVLEEAIFRGALLKFFANGERDRIEPHTRDGRDVMSGILVSGIAYAFSKMFTVDTKHQTETVLTENVGMTVAFPAEDILMGFYLGALASVHGISSTLAMRSAVALLDGVWEAGGRY